MLRTSSLAGLPTEKSGDRLPVGLDRPESQTCDPLESRRYLASLVTLGALFFTFGFVTWLNGPLITFAKLAFALDTDSKAFLVTSAFYLSYFFLALPSSWVLQRTGMKRGMAVGLAIMAVGTVLFGCLASSRNYPGALLGLFVTGSGLALLQTAANPYASVIGPIESAARRISALGICNKIAGILSPLLMGGVVLHGIDTLEERLRYTADPKLREALLSELASRVQTPYLLMASVLALMVICILFSPLPELRSARANQSLERGAETLSIRRVPHLWLGALCIFLYVGVEVMAGDAIGTYGKGFQLPTGQTKYFTAMTMAAMLLGYVGGLALIPRHLSQAQGLAVSAVLALAFTTFAWLTTGYTSVGFVAALGLANALMWPTIFPLAITGLGKLTERGSAILIMGIAGGALIPRLFTDLKVHLAFQTAFFWVTAPCYSYILFYAMRGHRVTRRSKCVSSASQS